MVVYDSTASRGKARASRVRLTGGIASAFLRIIGIATSGRSTSYNTDSFLADARTSPYIDPAWASPISRWRAIGMSH